MYLTLLNQEEKMLFLELAYKIACADGVYSEEEKLIMDSYCKEMQIKLKEEFIKMSMDEILEKISTVSDDRNKKIFIFEAIGLAMIDGTYAEEEENMILHMANLFGVENVFVKHCENILNEYIKLQEKMNNLILA